MKMSYSILFSLVLASCSFKNDKINAVDAYVQQLHEEGKFEGTLAIGNKEGFVFEKAYGIADRSWNIPFQHDTRLDICSINKSFMGLMIMQLVESDRIKLDDPITKHLNYSGPYADEVTIHQMLSHTSGLPDYDAIADSLKVRNVAPFKRMYFESQDYIDFISSLEPISAPNQKFYYSNFAYHLLALLIEDKTNQSFSRALDSMICKPLGLTNTYAPENNEVIYERLASSYLPKNDMFVKSPFIDYSLGRRIFSTSKDLMLWGKHMLDPTLISTESRDLILTNHVGELNPEVSYGYGWAIIDSESDARMGRMNVPGNYFIHGGATDGYRSLLTVYEDGEWIVAHLTNIGDRANELVITESILNLLINE